MPRGRGRAGDHDELARSDRWNELLQALNPVYHRWWMLLIPCTLLAVTLLSLNFLGDGLRDVFDPKREQGKL